MMSETPDHAEESRRVSTQIMSLSTQLIDSIEKQSTLEKDLNQANKILESQYSIVENYEILNKKFEDLKKRELDKDIRLKKLEEDLRKEKNTRAEADANVDKVNREVEELTASLFDEANNMVADARKVSHATELRNSKLIEQLHERDALLETLNLQLKNLKKVIQALDDDSMASDQIKALANASDRCSLTASLSNDLISNHGRHIDPPLGPIFSPNITAIRYDLGLYQEFLKFLAVLPNCQDIKETSSDSKLIRKLVSDEIQPVLKLEQASSLGWIIKRTLINLMIEGLVAIEPISGLNEKHQYGHRSSKSIQQGKGTTSETNSIDNSSTASPASMTSKSTHSRNNSTTKNVRLFNYPSDSPPVAMREKCAICGENRDEIIEHARLHILKTQSRADDGTLTVNNTFPLCKYCVLKVRQSCEIFAFLRSLKLGAWKLENVSLTNVTKGDSKEFSRVSSNISNEDKQQHDKDMKRENRRSARRSFIAGMNALNANALNSKATLVTPDFPVSHAGAPTTNIQWAWIQLCRLRIMLHWAHIGIWNVEDAISSKIGPLVINDNDGSGHDKISKTNTRTSASPHKGEFPSDQTMTTVKLNVEGCSESLPIPSTPLTAGQTDTFDFETVEDNPLLNGESKDDLIKKESVRLSSKKPNDPPEVSQEKKDEGVGKLMLNSVKNKRNTDKNRNNESSSELNVKPNSNENLLDNLDKLSEELKEGMQPGDAQMYSVNYKGTSSSKEGHQGHRNIRSILNSDNESASASNTDDQFDDAEENQGAENVVSKV